MSGTKRPIAETMTTREGRTDKENPISKNLSEVELALVVLSNATRRWIYRNRPAETSAGLSDVDIFILHLLVYRNGPMRVADLAFALSIEDLHQVTYALKKLVRTGFVKGAKSGKEVFYTAEQSGRDHYDAFLSGREEYLEPAIELLSRTEIDLPQLANILRTLSGIYEQAARSAGSAQIPWSTPDSDN